MTPVHMHISAYIRLYCTHIWGEEKEEREWLGQKAMEGWRIVGLILSNFVQVEKYA